MATSQVSMIPQLEEICREAMRVDQLGDNLDGTIGGDVSEATVDVCCNAEVVTLIRKTLPEIEKLIVYKATDDEDGWHAALLEDAIGTLISNFLIAAARIYPAQRETRRDDNTSHTHVSRNLTVLPPSSAKLLLWNSNGKSTPFDPTHRASNPPNDAA
jgi:hypothetical protein